MFQFWWGYGRALVGTMDVEVWILGGLGHRELVEVPI
jgi:hypothetical protein